MEKALIEALELVAKTITEEAKQKREWGHFGNSLGRSESIKTCEFCAEVLMAVANNI